MPIDAPLHDTSNTAEEARNLSNTQSLMPWLDLIAMAKLGEPKERDERQALCAKWLSTVGRKAVMKSGEIHPHHIENLAAEPEWIQKAIAEGKPIHALALGPSDRSKLERAIDWLIGPAGPATRSDWSRLSLQAALEAEAAWIQEMSKAASDSQFDAVVKLGTTPLPGLEDLAGSELGEAGSGFSWVELTLPEALAREGGLMRHCVGIYGDAVKLGKTRIFSLRSPAGDPLATVELAGGNFKQLKLKGDNQTDYFCATAARSLILNLLPSIRAKGALPHCGPDFVKTGFGHTNILGFCDLALPLGAAGKSLASQWIAATKNLADSDGAAQEIIRSEMKACALAGGLHLFRALQGHAGKWWRDASVLETLFSNEAMLPCLNPILNSPDSLREAITYDRPGALPSGLRKHLSRVVSKAIQSGSPKVWSALWKLRLSSLECFQGVESLAMSPGSVGDEDLANFIAHIPSQEKLRAPSEEEDSVNKICPSKKISNCAELLSRSRFAKSVQALRIHLGDQTFPWTDAARGACSSDSVGILGWVLEHAPPDRIFAGALSAASKLPNGRCLPMLANPERARIDLGIAFCEASALTAPQAIKAFQEIQAHCDKGDFPPISYAHGLADAARIASLKTTDLPLFRSVESLAWLLERSQAHPDFPTLLHGLLARDPPGDRQFKPSHTTLLSTEPENPAEREAGQSISSLCRQHLSATTLIDLCSAKIMHGLDQPALLLWNAARGQSDFDQAWLHCKSDLLAKAAELECDAFFACAGGSKKDLAKIGATVEKAMSKGCWRMAAILAEDSPRSAELVSDALIDATAGAPLATIKALLPKCDPKRRNSQALVAAARAGRLDAAELLLPLSDAKAQASEALRSAAARGDARMVDLLLPASDPRAADSIALRDAIRAGFWDIAMDLWPLSDPNGGAGEALAMAARKGEFERVAWMIENGADPKMASSGALRALITQWPSSPKEAFELLWERSDPTDFDHVDLLAAVKANRVDWVGKLLPHANPDANNCSALRCAAKMGELELMEILIPASDPFKAEAIIKAEGFDDEGEAMLLALITSSPSMAKRSKPRP